MEIYLVLGLLALVLGGFVCMVWGTLGGPRWVRVLSVIMLGAGEFVLRAISGSGRTGPSTSSDSD
ncbi:hypothetical protein OHB00_37740 [Streptomyces sp. NBC_00631]|uniref:hypothetical protein n=1 Tax=Streptomyces sp. NBC_00631 TaxID=2975793 RepID=UPI0030E13AC2